MSAAPGRRGHAPFRVAVLGGGYAALAAALSIRDQAPEADLTLIAPRQAHIKTTRLHESLRHSLRSCCVLYADLARRFGLRFVQGKLRFDQDSLLRWQDRRYLQIGEQQVHFDFLVIATGARSAPPPPESSVLTLDDFFLNRAQTDLQSLCARRGSGGAISVVGGGATGIQFLFEIAAFLRPTAPGRFRLRLITLESRLLTQFPPAFHKHVAARLRQESIDWLASTEFLTQEGTKLTIKPVKTQEPKILDSDLTLLFSGVRPAPQNIETDAFGRVQAAGIPLTRIFAAGDCARFPSPGADTLSAQVAVRKGKLVARNVVSAARSATLAPYRYKEQGYIVSLGPKDAIGWVGNKRKIVCGLPAVTLKAAIEQQYDLLMAGADTYRV
ncbi:NAD(P)/FAD-dependent oxidoreductase [Methyloterricola oryzae]|uniref:NAD(P)/FAD-dependent oxidoreductase n=1 Tax=Methyloterricola oryzae TaxID=1495050 RepID=UPI0005EAE681|nr:FAD-dependent oxidoreductase [Methyloterricola oryzae]